LQIIRSTDERPKKLQCCNKNKYKTHIAIQWKIFMCVRTDVEVCVRVCVGEVKIIARKSFLIKNYA